MLVGEKKEYGHHLLSLSVRTCTDTHRHTHNVLLERDLEIWNGRNRWEDERVSGDMQQTCKHTKKIIGKIRGKKNGKDESNTTRVVCSQTHEPMAAIHTARKSHFLL